MCRFGIGTEFPRKPNSRADGRGRDLERVCSETFPVFISCLLERSFRWNRSVLDEWIAVGNFFPLFPL